MQADGAAMRADMKANQENNQNRLTAVERAFEAAFQAFARRTDELTDLVQNAASREEVTEKIAKLGQRLQIESVDAMKGIVQQIAQQQIAQQKSTWQQLINADQSERQRHRKIAVVIMSRIPEEEGRDPCSAAHLLGLTAGIISSVECRSYNDQTFLNIKTEEKEGAAAKKIVEDAADKKGFKTTKSWSFLQRQFRSLSNEVLSTLA